jgi:hypothetical protein
VTDGRHDNLSRYSVRVLLQISATKRAQTNRVTITSQSEGCREAGMSPVCDRHVHTGLSKQTDRNTVTRTENCNGHHNTCAEGPHSFWNCGRHRSTECTRELARLFLRSRQSLSYSRIPQYFTEPEGSLPCSHEPSTTPYTEPDQSTPYYLTLLFWEAFWYLVV